MERNRGGGKTKAAQITRKSCISWERRPEKFSLLQSTQKCLHNASILFSCLKKWIISFVYISNDLPLPGYLSISPQSTASLSSLPFASVRVFPHTPRRRIKQNRGQARGSQSSAFSLSGCGDCTPDWENRAESGTGQDPSLVGSKCLWSGGEKAIFKDL